MKILKITPSAAGRLLHAGAAGAALFLFFTAAAVAEAPPLSEAEVQGQNLARQLLDQAPATNFIQTGVLRIKPAKASPIHFTLRCEGIVTRTNWSNVYRLTVPTPGDLRAAAMNAGESAVLGIGHFKNQPNRYVFQEGARPGLELKGGDAFVPFGNSDFWLCDLGLEFLHWPQQKILKREFKRNCGCAVLESTNPHPTPGSYSRVVAWIDNESGGIVQAEAYDANHQLLKEFAPKSFKKVDGQWELQEMEIRNVQTGSRTGLKFDLQKP